MFLSRFTAILLLIFCPFVGIGQELKCNVSINSQKIQGTNRTIFQNLQKAIYEFMNNTAWTNNVFGFDERIECSIMFNLTEQVGSDEFKGSIQVQSRRPVYNTSYNTTMLNYLDQNLQFTYREFDKLEFSENTNLNNLSSILAFYAYIIIGLDYDSFSNLGGNDYFLKAEKIVTNAQQSTEKGWRAYEGNRKNRYWLIENLLNSKYKPLREVIYKYHRLGLDRMSDKVVEGRAEIATCLESLQKIYREKPDPYMFVLQLFFDAKSDELVNVFSESFPTEKARVVNILTEIDNSNASKYKKILEDSSD
ncbi:MAG TPA: DUF4835 family protein [Tenuifilaceae bacterium]|nr:DUF4835 family protein [Tenuifilaceae bacterium]HRX31678.1 DUF4835 family protein [Tenuifilaceae bacterium]